MCLVTKQTEPLIAEKDIVSWKILVDLGNNFAARHWFFVYKEGIKYVDILSVPKAGSGSNRAVYKAFHSYSREEYVDMYINKHGSGSLVKAKCILPKGTSYYEGYHETNDEAGYASDMITIEKIYSQNQIP